MAASSSFYSSSSSTNLINPQNKYDVFLSFRGEDTRDNFVSHLYKALCQKNIHTFIDDQLNQGDEISKSILDAIEASSISLIIFSERYASSRWCLDELLKICECKKKYQQIVIPIFYGVDPSDVRKQSGTFGILFSKLQEGPIKMQSWKDVLTGAANLSGFHSLKIRPESKLLKKVVNYIVRRLAEVFPCDNKDQLVGVELRVSEIESLLALCIGSKDACTLGIWGIGGIGKTTIARAVFHKLSGNFQGSCFLQNVREESERLGGLACLQQKLVSKLVKDENLVTDIYDIDFNLRRLGHKKVLIVLDDVTYFNQIESLIGSLDWFMPESRIIITTRNKQVLRNWGVKKIFEVKILKYHHALELFSRHAFKQNHPYVGYEEHSDKVIKYTQGVPLALKVLGCFLFEREKDVCESAINKLEKIIHPNIQEVLKISYDDLDDKEKNIFLDLACFFKGAEVYPVMKFFDANGFYPEIGMSVLADKSLIIISYNKIIMHDLVQEMGREIVRQESVDDPGKRSRLWHHEDIFKVLTFNTGTETIEGICLDMSKVKEINLNPSIFTKMHKLRFLKFYNSINGENKCKVSYFQGSRLAEVKYLHWHGYPLKSLPSNIHLEKLVTLEMPNSNIEQLWDGVQHHGDLKQIILATCRKLFAIIPNPVLTQHPNKLVTLNLSGCKNLKSISAITHLECLQDLDLSYCSKLKRLPENLSGNIENIYLSGTAIEELPLSIGCLSKLLELELLDCRSLKSLPNSLCKLKSLKCLFLNRCSNLQRLPDELGNLEALRTLNAEETAIREVPSSIGRLKNLKELYFNRRWGLSLSISFHSEGLQNLTRLHLNGCGITKLPENLGQLSSLMQLHLQKNNFERIPESIIQLFKLSDLFLNYCDRLQSLPNLPRNLHSLDAHHCTAMELVSDLFSSDKYHLYSYRKNLSNNFKLDQNRLRRILEDALQHIQLMATERWKRLREEKYYLPMKGHVFLSGNEIPMRFKFQSMGSCASWKMSPGFINNNKVIGFAFSVIVEFGDHHICKKGFNVFCEYNLDAEECDWPVNKTFVGAIDYVESDHLLLGYYLFSSREVDLFWNYNCVLKTFRIYCTESFNTSEPLECCPVKKCGIQLLYASVCKRKIEVEVSTVRKKMAATQKTEIFWKASILASTIHKNNVLIELVFLASFSIVSVSFFYVSKFTQYLMDYISVLHLAKKRRIIFCVPFF